MMNDTLTPTWKKKFNPPSEEYEHIALAAAELIAGLGVNVHTVEHKPNTSIHFQTTCRKGRISHWKFHKTQGAEVKHPCGKKESVNLRGIAGLLDRLHNRPEPKGNQGPKPPQNP